MKKAILTVWFAGMGFGAFAQAQTTEAPKWAADMPQVSTNQDIRQMANRLQLNEGQYIRLRDLSKARQEQIEEINSMYSNDPAMRHAKIQAAQQEFDAQLAQSISQKQFTAYLQMQGRNPAESRTYQAGGYGGRSLEEGLAPAAAQPAAAQPAPPQTTPAEEPVDANIDKGNVGISQKAVKINSSEGEMKVKPKKEKLETKDMEYKADRDEVKIKSKDGTIKAKSEKGKTKVETPEGKMKMKNGEVKVKPKKG